MFDRLRWYGARLATMSAPEIGHRVVETGRKARFRHEKRGWNAIVVDDSEPFTNFVEIRQRLRDVPSSCGADFDPSFALGRQWPPACFDGLRPRPLLWRFDPVSSDLWPGEEQAGFDVDLRSTSAMPDARFALGDVKFVWEPARLQALHWFAVRSAKGDPSAFDDAMAWIDSWMEHNPPWRGVHWTSGIEIGLRIVSVVLVIAADAERANAPDARRRLASFLLAHAAWLEQFPSLYSSANNHCVAEALGLLLAGLALPDSSRARRYARAGRNSLEREAPLQILADGVGAEQSPTYQAFTMEMLALGQLVATSLGMPLAGVVDDRLAAGVRFLSALQDRDGATPSIGDDDEGRVLTCVGSAEPRYVASVVQAVCGLLRIDGLSPVAPLSLREALFRAPPVRSVPIGYSVVDFAQGGYAVVRDGAAGHDYHLVFDRGPLGYLSIAAHGHADALAIWLGVDGTPVLIDAGTWLYHSGRDRRAALRRSQAHNTLSIAGRSQSEPSSAFSWRDMALATATETSTDIDAWRLAGVHDGYIERFGVRHVRSISKDANGFSVHDRLTGKPGVFACEIVFLLAETVEAERMDGCIILRRDGAVLLEIHAQSGMAIALQAGNEQAQWSPSFGVLRPTTRIVLSGSISESGHVTRFVFVPGRGVAA